MDLEQLRALYPKLQFKMEEGSAGLSSYCDGVCYNIVMPDGTLNAQLLSWLHNKQLFLSYEDELVEKGKLGHYAIILADKTIYTSCTEGAALTFAKDQAGAFVCRVGESAHGELCSLTEDALSKDELPIDFDVAYPETDGPEAMTMLYRATNRRWLCASLRLENGKYRKTWVLVDTGAASSYLRPVDRAGVKFYSKNLRGNDVMISPDFLGCRVLFRHSEDADNKCVHAINLVGSSFINQFLFIDDFLSNYLMLSKRPDGPVEVFHK